jgi:hypothetical protein
MTGRKLVSSLLLGCVSLALVTAAISKAQTPERVEFSVPVRIVPDKLAAEEKNRLDGVPFTP